MPATTGRAKDQEPSKGKTPDDYLAEAGVGSNSTQAVNRSLHAHVMRAWNQAKIARTPHEREMLRCLRQRNGEYEPELLKAIREGGGSEIFAQVTQVKCRAIESWVRDILMQGGQRPFDIQPTEVPDVPEPIRNELKARIEYELAKLAAGGVYPDQHAILERLHKAEDRLLQLERAAAAKRAERMLARIADEFEEGGFENELEAFINDFVTYPTAFFAGPLRAKRDRLGWADQYGRVVPKVESRVERRFERISPWDAFPAPNARSLDDGPLIIRRRWRPEALYDYIGLPSYNEQAIRSVLNDYGHTGYELLTSHEDERNRAEGRDHEDWASDKPLEAIDYWGRVPGHMLLEWGMSPEQVPDRDDWYECNVVQIGAHIIRAALNPHPLGRRPFRCASFEKVNGMVWGRSPPMILRDIQDQANNASRALANNMAVAAGFIGDVNIDRLADGENPYDIYPFRMFQTTEGTVNTARPAINFYQPTMNAKPLMEVFKFYSDLADEYSGIPPYAQGQNTSGGAAATATGLSILMEQAARGIKYSVWAIDSVIEDTVEATWEDLMLYDPDESIKGDIRIVARASNALMHRDRQAARLTEVITATNNPVDQQIIQVNHRRNQLEELFKAFDLPVDKMLPSEDELRTALIQRQREMMMQQGLQDPDGQAGQSRELTVDGRPAGGPQPEQRMVA